MDTPQQQQKDATHEKSSDIQRHYDELRQEIYDELLELYFLKYYSNQTSSQNLKSKFNHWKNDDSATTSINLKRELNNLEIEDENIFNKLINFSLLQTDVQTNLPLFTSTAAATGTSSTTSTSLNNANAQTLVSNNNLVSISEINKNTTTTRSKSSSISASNATVPDDSFSSPVNSNSISSQLKPFVDTDYVSSKNLTKSQLDSIQNQKLSEVSRSESTGEKPAKRARRDDSSNKQQDDISKHQQDGVLNQQCAISRQDDVEKQQDVSKQLEQKNLDQVVEPMEIDTPNLASDKSESDVRLHERDLPFDSIDKTIEGNSVTPCKQRKSSTLEIEKVVPENVHADVSSGKEKLSAREKDRTETPTPKSITADLSDNLDKSTTLAATYDENNEIDDPALQLKSSTGSKVESISSDKSDIDKDQPENKEYDSARATPTSDKFESTTTGRTLQESIESRPTTPTLNQHEIRSQQHNEQQRHKNAKADAEAAAAARAPLMPQAAITNRVAELIRQGMWSQKRLPKVHEPARPKVHWDFLLEEMAWLATDFVQERRWKKITAKKCAKMVSKYHQDKRQQKERAERMHVQHLKRIASTIAKEIRIFWSGIEKVVDQRQQSKLDEKRKMALDLHLKYIVDQTEKYSSEVQKSFTENLKAFKTTNTDQTANKSSSVLTEKSIKSSQHQEASLDRTDCKSASENKNISSFQESTKDKSTCRNVAPIEKERPVVMFEDDKSIGRRTIDHSDKYDIVQEDKAKEVTTVIIDGIEKNKTQKEEKDNSHNIQSTEMTTIDNGEDSRISSDADIAKSSATENDDDDYKMSLDDQSKQVDGEKSDMQTSSRERSSRRLSSTASGTTSSASCRPDSRADHSGDDEDEDTLDDDESQNDDATDIDDDDYESVTTEDEDASDATEDDGNSESSDEKDDAAADVGIEYLINPDAKEKDGSTDITNEELKVSPEDHGEDEKSPSKRDTESVKKTNKTDIKDIAAGAESIQPKGNTLETTTVCTKVPPLLKHTLREYQHIGLDWLVAMYNKKLNGILADEMGLGKTIQTIALLAHLACERSDWGPHLIVVPTSVMLNWEMEFKKWCPAFKILTYYGTPKERKLKRQGWTKPNSFHVCITSYRLVIQDHNAFRRKKWRYFILDEAHNIKNFRSQRWQILLNFNSHRRLLLTGTPLQNDLMELWSLMHFLMPSLFDSHREFKDWFVNPVTGMIEGNNEYNEQLIQRLHKVLRPFLLRRLKCDVERQLPQKYEHIVPCRLSKRQRFLYEEFMSLANTKETLAKGNFLSVINVLMQLRKVCNHPNLFEPRPIVSPYMMGSIIYKIPGECYNTLDYDIDKQVNLNELGLLLSSHENLQMSRFDIERISQLAQQSFTPLQYLDSAIHSNLARTTSSTLPSASTGRNIARASRVSADQDVEPMDVDDSGNSIGDGKIETSENSTNLELNLHDEKFEIEKDKLFKLRNEQLQNRLNYMSFVNRRRCKINSASVTTTWITRDLIDFFTFSRIDSKLIKSNANDDETSIEMDNGRNIFKCGNGYSACKLAHEFRLNPTLKLNYLSSLVGEILKTPEQRLEQLNETLERFVVCVPGVSARPISLHVSHCHQYHVHRDRLFKETLRKKCAPRFDCLNRILVNMRTSFPELRLIQYDCGKLQTLSELLWTLKSDNHRVLIFTQMSRMLDILEQFLNYHGHTYLRLDGATRIDQRQALMDRFNNDKRIFCFILSTRSGGIGVNLTGADTVIFYDSDWNPTMDAQAQDRCHRIGQTRDVHIYRLISRRTIEENILTKARQKRLLGDVAIEGGNFTTAFFKKQALQELFNINEIDDTNALQMTTEITDVTTKDDSVERETTTIDVRKLEQALCKGEANAGEELDVVAATVANQDAEAELKEFDETIPLNDLNNDDNFNSNNHINSNGVDGHLQLNENKSEMEMKLDMIVAQLPPIQKYAVKFLESIQEPFNSEELKQAEEELEQQKRDWEQMNQSVKKESFEDDSSSSDCASDRVELKNNNDKNNPGGGAASANGRDQSQGGASGGQNNQSQNGGNSNNGYGGGGTRRSSRGRTTDANDYNDNYDDDNDVIMTNGDTMMVVNDDSDESRDDDSDNDLTLTYPRNAKCKQVLYINGNAANVEEVPMWAPPTPPTTPPSPVGGINSTTTNINLNTPTTNSTANNQQHKGQYDLYQFGSGNSIMPENTSMTPTMAARLTAMQNLAGYQPTSISGSGDHGQQDQQEKFTFGGSTNQYFDEPIFSCVLDDKDLYIDYTLQFLYESEIMQESELPPVTQPLDSIYFFSANSGGASATNVGAGGISIGATNHFSSSNLNQSHKARARHQHHPHFPYQHSMFNQQHLLQSKIDLSHISISTAAATSGLILPVISPTHAQAHAHAQVTASGTLQTIATTATRKPKIRRDEVVCLPKSLFDRQSSTFAKLRRDLKIQKLRCVTKGNDSDPFAMQKFFTSFLASQNGRQMQPNSLMSQFQQQPPYSIEMYQQDALPPWTVQEEWAALLVIQQLQDLPLNLCILSPAHLPNWDFVSDVVNTVGFVFRSLRMCWYHYERIIQPREMREVPELFSPGTPGTIATSTISTAASGASTPGQPSSNLMQRIQGQQGTPTTASPAVTIPTPGLSAKRPTPGGVASVTTTSSTTAATTNEQQSPQPQAKKAKKSKQQQTTSTPSSLGGSTTETTTGTQATVATTTPGAYTPPLQHRPSKTATMLASDTTFIDACCRRFEAVARIRRSRPPPLRTQFRPRDSANTQLLHEFRVNYDRPLTPMQVARNAKETRASYSRAVRPVDRHH